MVVPGSAGDWIQMTLIGGAFSGLWVLLGRALGREESSAAEVARIPQAAREPAPSADWHERRPA
jgi:hypothetical protein